MNRQNRLKAFFCIFIGFSMVALWTMLLLTDQVPELISSPFTTITHITAETLTGISLIIAGFSLLRGSKNAKKIFLFASGMLIYASVQAIGYYIDHPAPFFIGLFIIIIIITAILVRKQTKFKD
jgi:hypothetical protein